MLLTCNLLAVDMSGTDSYPTNKYVRNVLRPLDPPPPISARFFYTSHFKIDDPLSPLPPPQQQQQQQHHHQPIPTDNVGPREGGKAPAGSRSIVQTQQPPRPFSAFDNEVLEQAWLGLRRRTLKSWERRGETGGDSGGEKKAELRLSGYKEHAETETGMPIRQAQHQAAAGPGGSSLGSSGSYGKHKANNSAEDHVFSGPGSHSEGYRSPRKAFTAAAAVAAENTVSLTGTPFIRAPSRKQQPTLSSSSARLATEPSLKGYSQSTGMSRPRPSSQILSSFDEENGLAPPGSADRGVGRNVDEEQAHRTDEELIEKVPVGVSRLHQVVMPHLQ